MSHLEVIQPRRQALPFTETGYRSHFVGAPEVDAVGGPVAYVTRWLDWAAQDEIWQDTRQLEFDLYRTGAGSAGPLLSSCPFRNGAALFPVISTDSKKETYKMNKAQIIGRVGKDPEIHILRV